MEQVTDYAVLRVNDGKPSCVPFVKVAWRYAGPTASAAASDVATAAPLLTSHWMPLWCFHPLVVDSLSTTTPPIPGNHSAVMAWLIGTVARTCSKCRHTRCSEHTLHPTPDNASELKSKNRLVGKLQIGTTLDGLSSVSASSGPWGANTPGGFLLLGFNAPHTNSSSRAACTYAGSVRYSATSKSSRKRVITFGNAAAQRFLRSVFDTLAVRGISEAEVLDAFSYDAAEQMEASLDRTERSCWARQTSAPSHEKRKRSGSVDHSGDDEEEGEEESRADAIDSSSAVGVTTSYVSWTDALTTTSAALSSSATTIPVVNVNGGGDRSSVSSGPLVSALARAATAERLAAELSSRVADAELQAGQFAAAAATARAVEAEKRAAELASRVSLLEQREAATLMASQQREAAAVQRVAEVERRCALLSEQLAEAAERARKAEAVLAQHQLHQLHQQLHQQQQQQQQPSSWSGPTLNSAAALYSSQPPPWLLPSPPPSHLHVPVRGQPPPQYFQQPQPPPLQSSLPSFQPQPPQSYVLPPPQLPPPLQHQQQQVPISVVVAPPIFSSVSVSHSAGPAGL